MKFRMNLAFLAAIFFPLLIAGCGNAGQGSTDNVKPGEISPQLPNTGEMDEDLVGALGCKKATAQQIRVVNQGNAKKEDFLQRCARETGGSAWCSQLTRPNPSSISTFRCTYGTSQVHQLIHPSETTWKNAIGAVRLIQELEQKGYRVCLIYNWWRPEPYNQNVGGAAGRHPLATSVDVRFCSNSDANKAFDELCKYRKQGRIRAIGHYGTNALHFGVGDSTGNTWGRSCPG